MRMPKKQIKEYMHWIVNELSPLCQVCESAPSDDAHHLYFGAYKDDRYLLAVCRTCHQWCHANKKLSQLRYGAVVEENYEIYTKEKE